MHLIFHQISVAQPCLPKINLIPIVSFSSERAFLKQSLRYLLPFPVIG